MALRDVGRVLGLSYGHVDKLCKMVPFDPSRPQNLTECIAGEPRLQKLIKDGIPKKNNPDHHGFPFKVKRIKILNRNEIFDFNPHIDKE